jgi:hypothetical protein
MLDFGEPFFNLNDISNTFVGKGSALTALAHLCGYSTVATIDVVDKAILLLNRKANISCRDENGDTVLHTALKSLRLHDRVLKHTRSPGVTRAWDLSFTAPRDLLAVFITAGADVYTTNNAGKTPSMVAWEYGREGEWIEALELCGYDFQEVLRSCIHRPTCVHQTAKLSFHEYCEQRLERQYPVLLDQGRTEGIYSDFEYGDETESEEYQNEDDDDEQFDNGNVYELNGNEEIRVTTKSRRFPHNGGAMELPGRCLYCKWNGRMRRAERGAEAQVLGLDDLVDNNPVGFENFGVSDLPNNEAFDDQVPRADDSVNNESEGMDANLDIDDLLDDEMFDDTVGNERDGMDINLEFDDWLNDGQDFMQSFNDAT